MAPIVQEVELTNWVFKLVSGSFGVCVEGALSVPRDDGQKWWHSTKIKKRLSPKCLLTESGTVYILEGGIDHETARSYGYPASLIYAFKDGFPVGWLKMLQTVFRTQKESHDFDVSVWDQGCVSRAATWRRSGSRRRDSIPLTEAVENFCREKQLLPRKSLLRPAFFSPIQETSSSSAMGDDDGGLGEGKEIAAGGAADVKEVELKDWVIKIVSGSDVGVCVEGSVLTGTNERKWWHSTKIGTRLSPRSLITESGTVYILKGDMDLESARNYGDLRSRLLRTEDRLRQAIRLPPSGYPTVLIRAFSNGFPENWKEQLKILSEMRIDSRTLIDVSVWDQRVVNRSRLCQTMPLVDAVEKVSQEKELFPAKPWLNKTQRRALSPLREDSMFEHEEMRRDLKHPEQGNEGMERKLRRSPRRPPPADGDTVNGQREKIEPLEGTAEKMAPGSKLIVNGESVKSSLVENDFLNTENSAPECEANEKLGERDLSSLHKLRKSPRRPLAPLEEDIVATENDASDDSVKCSDDKEVVFLTKWCFYMSKSQFFVRVEGRRKGMAGNPWWKSGAVMKRRKDGLIETTSGTCYSLEGPMDVPLAVNYGYPMGLINRFEAGFPGDWRRLLSRFWSKHKEELNCEDSVLKKSGLAPKGKNFPGVAEESSTIVDMSTGFKKPPPPPLGTPLAKAKAKKTAEKREISPILPDSGSERKEILKHGRAKSGMDVASTTLSADSGFSDKAISLGNYRKVPKMKKHDYTLNMTEEQSELTSKLEDAGVNKDFKVSRSGRIVKNRLAPWAGQRILYDVEGNIVDVRDPTTKMSTKKSAISPDCSLEALSKALDVKCFTKTKQEQTGKKRQERKKEEQTRRKRKEKHRKKKGRRSSEKKPRLVDYSIHSSSDEEEGNSTKKKGKVTGEKIFSQLSSNQRKRREKEEREKQAKKRWTNDELSRLRILLKDKRPESDSDWVHVAKILGGCRTAEQCIAKADTVLGYSNQRDLEEQMRNESRFVQSDITARTGTLAHKTQSKKFMESYVRNDAEEDDDFFEHSEMATELAMPSLAELNANDSLLPALLTPTNTAVGAERRFLPARISAEHTPAGLQWEKPETPNTRERTRRVRYAHQLQQERDKRKGSNISLVPKRKKVAVSSYRGAHCLMIPELDPRMAPREDDEDSDQPEDYFSDDQD